MNFCHSDLLNLVLNIITYKAFTLKSCLLAIVFISLVVLPARASSTDENSKILIGEVTKMYMSSMIYIFRNQPLINGKSSDKSELQGEKFINNIEAVYKAKYQEPLPAVDHYIKRILFEAMVEVMADNKPLLHDNDIDFKGIIPATFAFQLSAKLATKGIGLKIKFTRTKDSIRNVLNTPDEWESSVMQKIMLEPKIYYDNNAFINDKPAFRQFTPLPMAGFCLACHGTPSSNPLNTGKKVENWTDIDMTGFKMEGWTINDFGGGVSISIEKAVLENDANL